MSGATRSPRSVGSGSLTVVHFTDPATDARPSVDGGVIWVGPGDPVNADPVLDVVFNTNVQPSDIGAAAQTDLDAHLADTTDAHDASAISTTAITGVSGSDVQAMLASLKTLIDSAGGGSSPQAPQPSDQNLKAWAYDPSGVATAYTPAAGVLTLVKLTNRSSQTFSALRALLMTPGTGATALANCFLGLYIVSGANLVAIGKSADQSSVWNAFGPPAASLTVQAGQSLTQAGNVWGGLLIGTQSTTPAQFRRSSASNSDANVGLTAGTDVLRFGKYGTGLTALPDTVPIASLALIEALWLGAS